MKALAGPVMVTSLWTWWSTTAPLGENEAECHPSPICSNIFPLSVIMKHLFCIVIHESWSLHLIGVINQYAKHFIFCIISEYSALLREIVDWMSLVVGVIGFVGNFASIYILSLPSVGRWCL